MTQPRQPVGTFCLVLHTHLPWLAHHGSWPVGEEWLHQSWAMSYDRVTAMLERLAERGGRELVTLGVTPVVAAQLDDPYCLDLQRVWLGDWYWRAVGMSAEVDRARRMMGAWEADQAAAAAESFDSRWRHGGSPVLRGLSDSGAVELIGGPLTHAFQPLIDPDVARFGLEAGLADAHLRVGRRPRGLWAPECGYRNGLADMYREAGVTHTVIDGPTMQHVGAATGAAHPIGDSGVVAFGRDLAVTYRVWSPRKGYPGGKWYRDFHSYDHRWGFRHHRVTSPATPSGDKAPYDPAAARRAVAADAADFVAHVRKRLLDIRAERGGRPGLTVAAYDTELFGHWWHEGPDWLELVLAQLPEAGVRVTTLTGAMDTGLVEEPIVPESGSWGAGKDWHIWDGEAVHDMVADNNAAQIKVLQLLKELPVDSGRVAAADQLVRDLALALASDWAFMVSHDSAAGYARRRHDQHHWSLAELADLIEQQGWSSPAVLDLTQRQLGVDGPFGHLDARSLARVI
jgi:1,4-alpha-glucan branching enzyme